MTDTLNLTKVVSGANEPDNPLEYYLKVISFVIANAWKGEHMAIENYSDMVPMLATADEKIETVRQAKDEAKHVLILEKLAHRLGLSIDESMIEDEWPDVRATFREAVERGDLPACLIIQDLMVESLAIGIYSTFADADNKDPETKKVAQQLLDDELEHLGIGLRRINALIAKDSDAVHDSLMWAHDRVMPSLFGMVRQACDFLCDRKGVPCRSESAFVQNGVLHLDGERQGVTYIDLNRLKVASLENYVDTLYKSDFRPQIVNQLIASMSAYEMHDGRETGVTAILRPVMR